MGVFIVTLLRMAFLTAAADTGYMADLIMVQVSTGRGASQATEKCQTWCSTHLSMWQRKCGWSTKACSACSQCQVDASESDIRIPGSTMGTRNKGALKKLELLTAAPPTPYPTFEHDKPMKTWGILPPDECGDHGYVKWGFEHAKLHSNLGGMGPDDGEQSLRYADIVRPSGIKVDLVVTAITPYVVETPANNKLKGTFLRFGPESKGPVENREFEKFGEINVRANSAVTLLFQFLLSGTNEAVNVSHFYVTMYDIDEGADSVEAVTFYDSADRVYKAPDCELAESGSLESGLTYTATTRGTGGDNPRDPYSLTKKQKARAITASFSNRSSWTFTFSVIGGKHGRNFFFAGFLTHLKSKNGCPELPIPDPPDCQVCIIWGDPHIITFDTFRKRRLRHPVREALFRTHNWKSDQLNVYSQGTFWLVRSERVFIQARYWHNRTHPDFTNLGALGVGGPFLNNNRLTIRSLSGKSTWNGNEILSHLPSTFENQYIHASYRRKSELVQNGKTGPGIDINLPDGVRLTVNRWKQSLAVKIGMCPQTGGQDGQCGNYNGVSSDDRSDMQQVHPSDFLF